MANSNLFLPPRTATLWPLVRDRIATTRMSAILGGAGRTYIEGDYAGPDWTEQEPGGRVVIVPTLPLTGANPWVSGLPTRLGFLVRTDFNAYEAPGYNVSVGMEAAQREAAERLEGWLFPTTSGLMAATAVRMVRPWQARALYDLETQGIVYLSSEYRVDVADPPS